MTLIKKYFQQFSEIIIKIIANITLSSFLFIVLVYKKKSGL